MKKEIKEYCKGAIKNMKNNKAHLVGRDKHETHLKNRDIHQRTDEICLLYSYFLNISFNKAKEELDCEELFVNVLADELEEGQ